LDENPYNLPYSTRKFVTIACVLAVDTDIIILDEPTAGQDILGMERISYIIKELIKQNKTVITITHDMEFVVDNFERVIVMANKQKIADKNKREIFWDFDVIGKAKIKQPHMSRLARSLNFSSSIINIHELIAYLEKGKSAG
jgi:energy-coupling factor transport system ATP-binding protein